MSYRIVGIPNRITIEEHPEGRSTLAQAIARAEILAGWGVETLGNLREVSDHEQRILLRGLGLMP